MKFGNGPTLLTWAETHIFSPCSLGLLPSFVKLKYGKPFTWVSPLDFTTFQFSTLYFSTLQFSKLSKILCEG
jgi:hypothetical protein